MALAIVTDEMWKQVKTFNRQITEEFLEQQQHLSPQTLKQYRSGLRQFFWFVKERCGNKELHRLKPKDALLFQNYLINAELSSSAIKFKRSAVSSLCGYMEIYYDDVYPNFKNIYTRAIPTVPQNKIHKKEPLTPDEMVKLSDELEKRGEHQKLAYIWFTYITGCRRAEAAQLRKEVVTYEKYRDKKDNQKDYYVTHEIRAKGRGKAGKVRVFQFNDQAMYYLRRWIEIRGEDDCDAVFVYKRKGKVEPLKHSAFNDWCTDTFTEIVGRRVHPHLFRSSRATNLVVYEGKSLESAGALLGHNSTETTKIYVVKDDSDDIDDVFG